MNLLYTALIIEFIIFITNFYGFGSELNQFKKKHIYATYSFTIFSTPVLIFYYYYEKSIVD